MAAFIFDASGIVKRYVQEIGTVWVDGLADAAVSNELFLTRIACVEVIAAITRRVRGGPPLPSTVASVLVAQFRQDAVQQYNVLEITPALLADAERLAEVHGLRGYDAVQLSASLELHHRRQNAGLSNVTLISADQELNAAAIAEGLFVDDPNAHP
jgi:predicted nucleic acid-binding protein